jgi:hypothetical protein
MRDEKAIKIKILKSFVKYFSRTGVSIRDICVDYGIKEKTDITTDAVRSFEHSGISKLTVIFDDTREE